MYLYFNEQGVLTTQIPHGEIVRQSGTFTMHFVFENDYDFVNQHTLTIAFKRPGEKDFGIFRYITTNQPRIEIFKKIKPSEVTYSFVEGQAYKIYEFVCDELVAATERAGEVQAVVRILDKNSLNHGKVSVENIIAQGLIQFHVERTFGKPYTNTISPTQYDYLLAYIDKKTEGINDLITQVSGKLDKVNGTGLVYTTDGMVGYAVGTTNDTIVKRTSDGRIKAKTPIEDDDVVTKSYLVGSEGVKTANDLLVLLETDDTGRMIVDLNETGNKVEIHLDNEFVDSLVTKDDFVKEEIITATVDCSHKYEITGNTGDEHGLAIDDQQMLIKKIQGHSRRKSLNLISFKPGTYAGVTLTYDSASGIYTLNGTSTGFSIPLKASLPQGTKVSFIAEVVSGTKTGTQNDISVMIDGTWIATDWVNTKTLSESISSFWMSTDITYTNYKVKINVVEGTYTKDTMPPFQPYDNTLVNSNNTLISTGRNLVDIRIPSINASEWKYLETTTTLLKGRYFIKIESNNNEGNCLINIGSFEVYPSGMKYNTAYWFDVPAQGAQGQIQFYSNTANSNVKVQIRYTPTGNINFDYEPYKQDIIQAPSLGEFDYYQEGKIYRQTSQVITLNGSENWIIEEISPSKRFIVGLLNQYGGCLNDNYTINTTNNLGIENQTTGTTWTGTTTGISAEGDNLHLIIEGITTVEQLKEWLKNNNIQMVFRLATPTIEDYAMPSGYAVYNGGLQIQQGDVPYTITKQYNLSQKAQILANIEVDREQAKMIEENNQKFNLIPKFSHVDINLPETSMNGTLTQEQLTTLQINDLNYIIFNNEIYSLNDKTHTADTLTYSHVGFENGKHLLKTISITVSTRAWVLNTTSVVDSYEYRMFKINNPSGNISTSIKEIYIYTNKFDTASRFQNFLQDAYDSDMIFAFSCVAITPTDTIINAQIFYDLNIDPSSYFVIFNDKTEYVEHYDLVVVESA